MKNINQIIDEFKQISNITDNDYMKLAHMLAQTIILMPKQEQIMSWEFVSNKFSEQEIILITNAISFYLKEDDQKKNFADGITKINENIGSLDNNILVLKQIKDSDGSIEKAINALEDLKAELKKHYKQPTMH